MAKSVLDRIGPEEYRKLRDQVIYDSTAANGLRWMHAKQGRRSLEIGSTFWLDGVSYQSPWVVLIFNDQWPEDGQNIVTRKDPTGSWADAANLDWALHGDSRKRSTDLARVALVRSVLGNEGPDLGDRLRLNAPCSKGHLWNGRQLGLQKKQGRSWKCVECEKKRQKERCANPIERQKQQEWYQQNLEEQRRKARERMAAKLQDPEYRAISNERNRLSQAKRRAVNGRESRFGFVKPPGQALSAIEAKIVRSLINKGHPKNWTHLKPLVVTAAEEAKLRSAIGKAGRSPSVARLVMDEQQRYWKENPEAKKKHNRQWDKYIYAWQYKCNPSFRRHECQRNSEKKARNRGNHTVKLCRKDLDTRYAEFDNQCAFCGSTDRLIVEHFIPRSKGGPHAIGNILPACHRCNTSKFNHDPEEWYRSRSYFSESRWRKILRVLGKRKGSVAQLPLL